jgi:hypothetical protein
LARDFIVYLNVQHTYKSNVLQSAYCPEKKSAEKYGLSSNFQILSESSEITQCVLDNRVSIK